MWNEEPALYRGRYYATRGTGAEKRRRSLHTAKLDVARRRLKDLINETGTEPRTVSDIFALYMTEKEDRHHTLKYVWRCLENHFGHLRPDQVTRESCHKYRETRGVSSGTIIRELGALRAALRWFDPHTPAIFAFPKSPPPKERYLTREEADKLLSACLEPHIELYIVLSLCTAARKSALLELTWDRVNFERLELDLGAGEANKRRAVVPINQTALRALEDAHKARLTDRVIEFRGRALKDIKRGFATAVEAAGLKNVNPHVLRHTAAVWMAESGVPMSEIAQYLGHSSTRVTESVYARYSTKYLRRAASSLELGAIAPHKGHIGSYKYRLKPAENMARVTRLELAASAVTGTCRIVQRVTYGAIMSKRDPYGSERVRNVHCSGCNCNPNKQGSQTGKRPSLLEIGKGDSRKRQNQFSDKFHEAADP